MTQSDDQRLEYFVQPHAGERPDAPCGPMATIAEALDRLARWSPGAAPGEGGAWTAPAMDVVAVPGGATLPAAGRPRHRFVLSGSAGGSAGSGGQGTELAPWWGVGTAIDELKAAFGSGRLALGAGERLRLSYRAVFTATPLEARKRLRETAARCLLGAATLSLVLPVLAILAVLVWKGWPSLSLGFLWENPKNNMTAGGIWAPLVGTFFLVLTSLAAAAPVGILAGIYLNEYARDNWLTRIVNLA